MTLSGKMEEISYGKNVQQEEISGSNQRAFQNLARRLRNRRQQRDQEW